MNDGRRRKLREIRKELDGLRERLEGIESEEQDCYWNIPDGIREGKKGDAAEACVDSVNSARYNVEQAIDHIESIVGEGEE